MLICEIDLWPCAAESSQQIVDYIATKCENGVVSAGWIMAHFVSMLCESSWH